MPMGVLKSCREQSIEAVCCCIDLRTEFCPEWDVKNFPVTLERSTEAEKVIKAEETMEVITK